MKCHDHNHKCGVGRFERYKDDEAYKLRNDRRWWATRDEAKDRDKHLCVACRLDNNPFYNAYQLEVHHILGVRARPDLVYEVSNTITLCNFHHKQVHDGKLDLEDLLVRWRGYGVTADTPPTLTE
jgi:hypothetical protein